MDPKDLKKYLAGLGIASLLAGGGAIAADKPAGGSPGAGRASQEPR